jgi:hypothetical protein
MRKKNIQVLVKPLWNNELGGKLFQLNYPGAFGRWRSAAADLGIAIDGWDMLPLEEADCVWFLDLPDTRNEFEQARQRAGKGVPFVLQVMETPTGRSQNFHTKNHALFDYIVTYQQGLPKSANIFTYRLPNCFDRFRADHKQFHNRKCAVMVNSNRVEGWFACRKAGLVGLPGIGPNLSGWHRPFWAWIVPARGELYSWRRRFARLSSHTAPNALEIYGPGWDGSKVSWLPIYDRKRYTNCVSSGFTNHKLDVISNYRFTISVENYRGNIDYISEKIFEPLMVGSVPVYLGEEKITDIIPKSAFVDVRDFSNKKELIHYLQHCTEKEWRGMYEAGQEFLFSKNVSEFSREEFVSKMISILKIVLKI